MSASNQTPAQTLIAMLMSARATVPPTDAQADKAISDFLTEIAALDVKFNRGQAIREDQLAEQLFGAAANLRTSVPYAHISATT
jgi:hypothetical protein